MASKDNCSFSKQSFSSNTSHTDNDNRYSNVNLNLKYGSPTFIPVHSSSKLSNEKRSAFDNYVEKGQSQSWNKSSKSCLNTVKLINVAEKEAKKDSKKDNFSKITNKSAFSLHIAAYENSSEVVATNLFDNKNLEGLKQKSLIEKQGNEKETFAVSTFLIQNPFEFPRQENTKAKEPEVSQFKLSQRLLSPNKASAMTTNPNLLTPFKATKADVESSSLRQISEDAFYVINEVVTRRLGHIPILKGDLHDLPYKVQRFVAEKAELMRPRGICICDGSQHEADQIISKLLERGMLTPLAAYENNYLCRTDPKDVARVESKTWMVTPDKYQTVTHTAPGVEPIMGHWMSPLEFGGELDSRFPGCMAGRIMYVIPFSMGPLGSPLAKIGVQLTDSNYVVLSMRIMTRVNPDVWEVLGNKDFVRCIHSVGLPRPVKQRVINHWPCNPERVLIAHRPSEREIWSFGSGYGGNSLLGKKCFALRIASNIAHDEGWLAEHMLIMGVTRPNGKEHFIAAAFPSACGKTNLAMLEPALPGWKVRCVGDDIAWMKFGEDGRLYAINPEAGFFGVAPGTSNKTNPMAVATFQKNSIFTNVAETSEGRYYWEGLEDEIKDKNVEITDWLGNPWKLGDATPAAHPNSRFAAPAKQCPIIHPDWESPQGVPIEAIIFGGRRPDGVPLVFETFGWHHGIFTGACLKSETTAAAEHKGKNVMHDPMAMRPFMGYNFGKYLEHWISLEKAPHKVPKIYHVNWFRKSKEGKFLWPGFGDNIRVIDWIIRRLDGEEGIGIDTAVGVVPSQGSINLDGLGDINWDELMSLPSDYWKQDAKEVRKFLEDQVGSDLPKEIREELEAQEKRIEAL